MRTIAPAAQASMASGSVVIAMLVSMQLTQPLLLSSLAYDITINGQTYIGAGNFGSIETIDDSPGEYKPLRFTLSAASVDVLPIALEEEFRGKNCSIRIAVFDEVTRALLDSQPMWSGTLDQMPITLPKDKAGAFSIGATAEHRGVTYARPKPMRYTDVDQQKNFPGDTSHRFVTAQANHPDVWPAASFGRQ